MISEALASLERRSPALAIHVLPAHQELIAPLPTGYVGPAMAKGEAWLRRFGYKTHGPWLISWGAAGQPQLRRPVSGALKAVEEGEFRTIEVPALLMLAVPFQGWPILPHNLMPYVQQQGFEPLGQPLLLAIGSDPPNIAWVPVMPRGTLSLAQQIAAGGVYQKIGLFPPPPQPGALLTPGDILHGAWISSWRVVVALSLLTLLLFNCWGVATLGLLFALFLDPWSTIRTSLLVAGLIFSLIFLLKLAGYWLAASRWNRFWNDRPAPPVLAIHSAGAVDGDVPAWFGS